MLPIFSQPTDKIVLPVINATEPPILPAYLNVSVLNSAY